MTIARSEALRTPSLGQDTVIPMPVAPWGWDEGRQSLQERAASERQEVAGQYGDVRFKLHGRERQHRLPVRSGLGELVDQTLHASRGRQGFPVPRRSAGCAKSSRSLT
ncbi:MAG: hypothetical protein ACREXU_17085, partial [Gammaproteobacteria bacterium]